MSVPASTAPAKPALRTAAEALRREAAEVFPDSPGGVTATEHQVRRAQLARVLADVLDAAAREAGCEPPNRATRYGHVFIAALNRVRRDIAAAVAPLGLTGEAVPKATPVHPYVCVNCDTPVLPSGLCDCGEWNGPCAGVLVRPHPCNPAYADPKVPRSSYSQPEAVEGGPSAS